MVRLAVCRWLVCIGLLFCSSLASIASAGSWHVNSENVLLDGYDLVAYQLDGEAIKGSPFNAALIDGVILHFSSKDNLRAFRRSPGKYLPSYNGYCAFAVGAKNAKVHSDPNTFKVINGRLFMFFNDLHEGEMVNTKVFWDQNESQLHSQADKNWNMLKED